MSVFLLIVGLVLFVALVVVHELGHLLAARRNGVKVEEFGIGFPPQAWHKKLKSGIVLSLNWLPLGGFVKLKGEHDADTESGSFGAASLGTKAKIMLAGVVMNLAAAAVLLSFLAAVGVPKLHLEDLAFYHHNQFTVKSDEQVISRQILIGVATGSPAERAGLKDNDDIISINGTPVEHAEQLPQLTSQLAGQRVTIVYQRDQQTYHTTAQLNKQRIDSQGFLGVAPLENEMVRYTWSAPIVGLGLAAQFTEIYFRGFGYIFNSLFHGQVSQASNQVQGPVGIFFFLKDSATLGYRFILLAIALISLALAVLNILPIPALDGGRLFLILLFRFLRRPLRPRTEELITGTSFVLLILLVILISFSDIIHRGG